MGITLATLLSVQHIIVAVVFLSQQPVDSPAPSSGLDPTVLAAFIGLGSALMVAFIAGGVAIYQTKKTARVAKQLQEQIQQNQFLHEKEMERFRRLLDKQEKDEESEKRRQEAAQLAMLRARTLEERVNAYRQSVCADPLLNCLQILGMTQPLEIKDIYVRLRVHQEARPHFQIDTAVLEAEKRHDPNLLLKLSKERLEQRATQAISPEEAIQTYKRCVIVGDPGAGKSTLLKHLTLLASKQPLANLPLLPLHIELNAFALSKQSDLLVFASDVWDQRYGFPATEALAYLQDALRKGEVLVLCDALDETVTGTNREEAEASYLHVSQAILHLATRYPLAPIVVTARKAGYHQRPRLPGFTEVEVLDFRQEDIIHFIQSWFAFQPDKQKQSNAADLVAKLQRHPRIEALAANPLLLTLITLVYEDQLDLPDRRAELYKQCVDTLLSRWDASRGLRRLREFKPEHKRRLLEEIAWHFHLQGQRYFPEAELLECIAKFLPAIGFPAEQNTQILAEIAAENGLLKEQAHGWHGFLHLTLQEYFVAQYATAQQQGESLLARRDNSWWEEVLLLYAGSISDASGLLQYLLEEAETQPKTGYRELFYADLLLAGRCLAASAVVKQVALRQMLIERLLSLLQNSPYSLTQRHSAETLAEIGGEVVQAQLVSLLSNEHLDLSVRRSIAETLGTLGERSMAPHLVSLLSNEHLDLSVRRSIADALGSLGERSVAPQLIALLSNEHLDLSVRWSIADALGTLGERSVAPQLVTLLSNKHLDLSVRRCIAHALGALGEKKEYLPFLASSLFISDIADAVHSTLWVLSRQLNLRILVSTEPGEERVKIVQLNEAGTYSDANLSGDSA